jgi:ACT domain-containing protein
MNAHHRSIAKFFVAATLLLSLARLQKLSKRQAFYKWHTDYVIPVELAGESYTVFFQMADDTDKLSQVLVRLNEMKSRTSTLHL